MVIINNFFVEKDLKEDWKKDIKYKYCEGNWWLNFEKKYLRSFGSCDDGGFWKDDVFVCYDVFGFCLFWVFYFWNWISLF